MPPLAGTPSTLHDMRKKTISKLLTFLVRASIKDIVFQNSWYQTTCPICKDPIFRRGEKWFCSAHGHIDKPNYIYKFSVIITDATDTIQAAISETSCRKLLRSPLDKFISDNPLTNGNVLPVNITNERGNTKTMSIQILRASTPENIRFIIIDHDTLTTMSDTSIPTTPAPTRMTRARQNDTSLESSTANQNVARPLSYDLTGTNTQMQTLLQDAPEELLYKELTITNQVITDIDKDTVLMLNMFDMMQENITAAIKICNKIIQDHPTP
ncbi:unnamed protein product [Lactuca saligna]|nr:unnamed protein product [Lactuca saligna]